VSEDLAHDAHLRAALRHAPDHALAPPSGLSQTILAAARQAHRPVRPTPAPAPPVRNRAVGARPLRAWLRRLFAPRWAGAWAAGLVAILGLGLWLDLELRPAPEQPAVVAMNSTPPETTTRAEAAREATSAGQAAADDAPTVAVNATPAAPAHTPEKTDMLGKLRTAPDSAVRHNEIAADEERQHAAERTSRDAAARQDSETPEPAAPAVEPQTSVRGAARLRAAPPDAGKAEEGETATAASPALTLLRHAQTELATGSAIWTWGPPGSAMIVPFDAAARAWLSRAVQAARGRWVEVDERGESPDALEVRWWRDGWPQATLRIEANGLRWIERGGRIRYAPLDAGTLQQLRSF